MCRLGWAGIALVLIVTLTAVQACGGKHAPLVYDLQAAAPEDAPLQDGPLATAPPAPPTDVPLPPVDAYVADNEVLARRGSVVGSVPRLGATYAMKDAHATVVSSLRLQLIATSGGDRCWALYKFENLLDTDNPNQLRLMQHSSDLGPCYIAWSNYAPSIPTWEWSNYIENPTGDDYVSQPEPGSGEFDPISPGHSIYCLVANVSGVVDESLQINKVILNLDADALPPATVSASPGTHGRTINVSWTAAPDGTAAIGYKLERALAARGPYSEIAELDAATLNYSDVHHPSDNPLPYNANVFYRVRTVTDNSPAGGAASLSRAGWRVLSIVTGVTATDGDYIDAVRIDWNPVAGATRYEIQYAPHGSSSWSTLALTPASDEDDPAESYDHNAAQPAGLEYDPPTNYDYRVRAHCFSDAYGTFSSPDSGWGGDSRGDWWMRGRNAAHNSSSPYNGPVTSALKWSYTTGGAISSSPCIGIDGTIYFGSDDYKLYAVNADGSSKWTYTTGGAVFSSPALAKDGTVYVGSEDGKLYAIGRDGSLKWAYSTGGSIHSSPAIGSDGVVYVGSNDHLLYALNPDGTKKWDFATGDILAESSPAIDSSGTVYIASCDSKLYAINPDGSKKWEYVTGSWATSSPAVGSDGTIYVGSSDHKLHAVSADGGSKWTYTTGNYTSSSPALSQDGTIYIASCDGKLYAVGSNGSLLWTYNTGGSNTSSSPSIGADGTVYVGSHSDHKLHAVKPDGSLRWSYATGSNIYSSPAIGADGTIYVGSADGKLYAFGPGNGPIARLEATPQDGEFPLQVQFDATASLDVDGDYSDLIFDWDWDGDGMYDLLDGGDSPVHQYTNESQYTAIVRVTDLDGKAGMAEIGIGRAAICYAALVDGLWGIWTMNPDGTGQKKVCSTGPSLFPDGAPTWSPDHTKIAWYEVSPTRVWIVNADGTGKFQVTSMDSSDPYWEDNEWLLFSVAGGDGNEIARIKTDGTGYEIIYRAGDGLFSGYPYLSPDGKRIVFCSRLSSGGSPFEVYTAQYPSFQQVKLLANPASCMQPAWAVTDKIFFQIFYGGIYRIASDGSGMVNISSGNVDYYPEPSPDGSELILLDAEVVGDYNIWKMSADGTDRIQLTNVDDARGGDWYSKHWPKAALEADPANGEFPLTVNFDASASYDMDNGAGDGLGITKYEWDWDGDGSYDFDSGTDPTVSHTFDTWDVYRCRIRVTDDDSQLNTAEVVIGALSWSSHTVDAADATGRRTSWAMIGGKPAISYSAYVDSKSQLRYARATSVNPLSASDWAVHTVYAPSFTVGEGTALIELGGAPAIAFPRGGGTTHCQYALAATASPGSSADWAIHTPSESGNSNCFSQLPFGGKPNVAWVNVGAGEVYFARATTVAPASSSDWVSMVVDTCGSGSWCVSLVNQGGYPAIAYLDGANNDLKYACATTAEPSSAADWAVHTVDSAGSVGHYCSMAIVNGKPFISHYDGVGDLKLARATTASPGSSSDWVSHYIDTDSDAGYWTSMCSVNGKAVIAYRAGDPYYDLRCAYALSQTPSAGTDWYIQTVDSSGQVGEYCALGLISGKPAISYWDGSNDDLKFAASE